MKKFACLMLVVVMGLTMLSFAACEGEKIKATSLSLSAAELRVNAGEQAKLTAVVDEAATQKSVEWSSANEQVATVSAASRASPSAGRLSPQRLRMAACFQKAAR